MIVPTTVLSGQFPLRRQVTPDQQHHPVAVHQPPPLVGQNDPVGIAVKGQPDGRAFR